MLNSKSSRSIPYANASSQAAHGRDMAAADQKNTPHAGASPTNFPDHLIHTRVLMLVTTLFVHAKTSFKEAKVSRRPLELSQSHELAIKFSCNVESTYRVQLMVSGSLNKLMLLLETEMYLRPIRKVNKARDPCVKMRLESEKTPTNRRRLHVGSKCPSSEESNKAGSWGRRGSSGGGA
ncbi:hypothetical protein M405DRAFT_847632 [Rhizopogon salebrosus TDB-379]|nr:hypothetical protein M405DRAFT_847632 [Rhizopogon salebrosus TDB-379]